MSLKSKFEFIDRLTAKFERSQKSTVSGAGTCDDAAVISCENETYKLVSSELFLEGIHFNLMYDPLKHLGYRLVTAGVSNIAAMNGVATQILVSVGISSRFAGKDMEALFEGVRAACKDYSLDATNVDVSTSLTGMTLSITTVGEVFKDRVAYRNGAQINDLICISGDLGAAYMGLLVLERERRIFESNHLVQPKLDGYDYILQRRLRPVARIDLVELLKETGIRPTSMTDITDGLASEMLHVSKQSGTGARIYIEKIPIASDTFKICEEMNFNAITAALNGGGDYELLFTVPLADYDKIKGSAEFNVIGHITSADKGSCIVTPEGEEIQLKAPGFAE